MRLTRKKTYNSVMKDFNKVVDDLTEVSKERENTILDLTLKKEKIEDEIQENSTEKDQCDTTISNFKKFLGISE